MSSRIKYKCLHVKKNILYPETFIIVMQKNNNQDLLDDQVHHQQINQFYICNLHFVK